MYHYVRELKHSRYPALKGLSVEEFKAQISYIDKYYTVISMYELIEAVLTDNELPKNALLLTFDDGYIDHFQVVFPILNQLKMPASFFPVIKPIMENKLLDANKIHFVLASVFNQNLLIEEIFSMIHELRSEYKLKDGQYYFRKYAVPGIYDSKETKFIKNILQKGLPAEARKIILDHLFRKYVSKDEKAFSMELYMSVDQIKCLNRNGMYIGCHGYEHSWLNNISRENQEKDIKLSLEYLGALGFCTNNWVMCYPYGVCDDSLIEILKAHGCILGLTAEVDIADLGTHDPFVLPRLNANDLPKKVDAKPNEWTLRALKE